MEWENISSSSTADGEIDNFPHHHYHRDTPPHGSYTQLLPPLTTPTPSTSTMITTSPYTLPRPRLSSPNSIPVSNVITPITRRSSNPTWQGRYNPIGRFVDQTASARLGRVSPPVISEPLFQIGGERYVVIDQVGCVDHVNQGAEPAIADQATPQAVAPDHNYHVGPPLCLIMCRSWQMMPMSVEDWTMKK